MTIKTNRQAGPQEQPTVRLVIGNSILAFDEGGEVLEWVQEDGRTVPDWDDAGICDHRGAGGPEGFEALHRALTLAEENARLIGLDVRRVKSA